MPLTVACFSGEATIGAYCESAQDCGDEQQCRHQICGHCSDGAVQAGEVCLASARITTIVPSNAAILPHDIEGDDVLDLVVYDPSVGAVDETIRLWRSDRSGRFEAAESIVLQADASVLASADVDGDGVPDLVVGTTQGVSVLYGPELGPGPRVVLPFSVHSVAAGWWDGSQSVVLATGGDPAQRVALSWSGDREGAPLSTPTAAVPGTRLLGPLSIDDDGEADFVQWVPGSSELTPLLSVSAYAPTAALDLGSPVVASVRVAGSGDASAAVMASSEDGRVFLVVPTVQGGLGIVAEVEARPSTALAALDLDADRRLDLLIGQPQLQAYLARGGDDPFAIMLDAESSGTQLEVGRFDGSFIADVLLYDAATGRVQILRGDP